MEEERERELQKKKRWRDQERATENRPLAQAVSWLGSVTLGFCKSKQHNEGSHETLLSKPEIPEPSLEFTALLFLDRCEVRKKAKWKVVPGIELGLPESESDVLTITLYNHLWRQNSKQLDMFFISHR